MNVHILIYVCVCIPEGEKKGKKLTENKELSSKKNLELHTSKKRNVLVSG